MSRTILQVLSFSLAGAVVCASAAAAVIPVGYISYDVSTPPGAAAFDIQNETGPNDSTFPDSTFPVATSVLFSSLSLTVSFASGPNEVFGASYFTLSPDGLSFNGTALSTGIGQPNGLAGANSAVLTGSFNTTTFTLNDGSTVTVSPTFSATLADPLGFKDGDLAVINANTGGPPPVPEPEPLVLVGTALSGLLVRRRDWIARVRGVLQGKKSGAALAVLLGALLLPGSSARAQATVKLNTWTSPSSGATGSTFVNLTGSGFSEWRGLRRALSRSR